MFASRSSILFLVASCLIPVSVWSAPNLLNYQGRLSDSMLPNTGPRDIVFSFYDSDGLQSPGAQIGTFEDMDTIPAEGFSPEGIFSTLIGDDDPGDSIPPTIFDTNSVYLDVKVDGTSLRPRLQLVSSAYALQADKAGVAEVRDANGLRIGQLGPTGDSGGQLVLNDELGTTRVLMTGAGNLTLTGDAATFLTTTPVGKLVKISTNGSSTGRIDVYTGDVEKVTISGSGNINAITITADNCCQSSDVRQKENVHELVDALERISKLRGISFDWIDENRADGPQIGVVAQEVEAVFPEVVLTKEDGMKAVDYSKLVAPLIESVKELNQKIENQAREIASLREELEQRPSGDSDVNP